MNVYRITREKYHQDLMGTGARLYGGRWNPKGVSMLYAADSRSLAAMELAVRMDLSDIMDDLVMITLSLSPGRKRELVKEVQASELPHGWDSRQPVEASQNYGKQFIDEMKYLALKVPSVAVRGDFNYLLNPMHPVFEKNVKVVETVPFFFDARLG